jgi:hypothetical protein
MSMLERQLALLATAGLLCLPFALAQEKTAPSCEVRVTTQPEGALVSCDGVMREAAPLVIADLAPGRHLIVASKQGYNDARHSIELSQTGQRVAVELKLEPILGLILVTSEPSGATVEIDGANRGETPLLLTDLPLGAYRMKLNQSGYREQEIDLKVDSRIPRKETVVLASNSATLDLSSDPTGARAVLNGVDRGTTPCVLEQIPEGDSTLELSLDGCDPFRQELKLHAGERRTLTAVLKLVPAKLSVVSIPAGARIYVNNQFKGAAPLTLSDLAPGSYRLRAEMTAHEPLARTIFMERASDITEEFRLTPNCGSLEIVTAPSGVRVYVDGKDSGTTTAKAGETDRVSDALHVEFVPIGTRRIKLTKKGFFSKEVPVVVERDRTATVHQSLKRRFIPNCEVRTTEDVIRGVLIEVDPQGNVKLEVRPGIMRTVEARDVVSRRVLRGSAATE